MRVVKLKKAEKGKERVCAYVRVSTDKSEQLNSFFVQSEYWERKLATNPQYEYLGIFADEGISGRSMKNRAELNEMLELARKGHIDRIFVKSVSRFARNWSETIETIRELRQLNIPVNFDKEGIDSNDPKCNLLLNVYASIAEEELRSMSENVKWSTRKRFENGSVELTQIYGYDFKDKKLIINKKEAEVVKEIFRLYLDGYGYVKIAQMLEKSKYKNKSGKCNWHQGVVRAMLRNEKYIGDSLLQKTFNVNMRQQKNNGELPQYYVKDSHEAIISEEDFLKVQEVRKERTKKFKAKVGENTPTYSLSGKIMCSKCGKKFARKINNKGTNYESINWMCRTKKDKTAKACSITDIKDDVLKGILVETYNESIDAKIDNTEVGQEKEKLNRLLGDERELRSLHSRGYIHKEQYLNTQKDLLNKIKESEEIIRKLNNGVINFGRLSKVDSYMDDILMTIENIKISKWRVTIKFINGYETTKKYTNGRAGNVNGKLKKTEHKSDSSESKTKW